jgi:hypothetical protein
VTDADLPEGRLHRARYLLTGRITPATAHPLELAEATRHILTHRDHDADTFHRDAADRALAELRISLGDWPRAYFGEAVLRSLVAGAPPGGCLRCRANLIARARGLHPPGWSEAVVQLIGPGCAVCRRGAGPGPRSVSADGHAGAARPVPSARLRPDAQAILAAVPPGAPAGVWQRLRDIIARDPEGLSLPDIGGDSVHPGMR